MKPPFHKRPQVRIVAASLVFALTWFFGLANRTNLWDVPFDSVRRSGISGMLRGGFSDLTSTVLVVLVAAACYATVLVALRQEFRHRFLFAVGGAIVVALAALPSAPLTSPDTTHFAADVRTFWLEGRDPTRMANVPNQVDDPVAREVRTFAGSPSGYGIVAYALGGLPLPFVGDGLRANVFGQKVLSGTMLVLTGLAAGLVAKRLGRNPAQAMAAIAMNPMFIWQFPGDGHNDIIMAAFGTIAVYFLVRKDWPRRGAGAALAALSVLTKYSVIIVAPVVAVAWFPKLRRIIGGFVGIGGVLFLVGFFGFFKPGIATIGPLEGVTRNTPWNFIFDGFNLEGAGHDVVIAICYSGAVLVIAAVCLFHKFETEQDLVDAIALTLALFLFLFAPTLRQWYLIWGFPVVMLSSRRWLRYGAVAFSLCGFLPTLAANWQITIANETGLAYPVQFAVVLTWLLSAGFAYWRWNRDQRVGRPSAQRARPGRAARRAAANSGRKRQAAR